MGRTRWRCRRRRARRTRRRRSGCWRAGRGRGPGGIKGTRVEAAGGVYRLELGGDGAYGVALPAATCATDPEAPQRLLVGGETYLVVEFGVPAGAEARGAWGDGR